MHLFGGSYKYLDATRNTRDKKKEAANFNSKLDFLDKNDSVVYTDRSQKLDKLGKIMGTRLA